MQKSGMDLTIDSSNNLIQQVIIKQFHDSVLQVKHAEEESASWVEVAVVAGLLTQLRLHFSIVDCKDCILVFMTVILVSRGSYATGAASNDCYLETVRLCTT